MCALHGLYGPQVIAGPDINPIVFLAHAASIVSVQLCPGLHTPETTADDYNCDNSSLMPTVLASTPHMPLNVPDLKQEKFRLTAFIDCAHTALTIAPRVRKLLHIIRAHLGFPRDASAAQY